jgi:predicted nucleic acid-binding protein
MIAFDTDILTEILMGAPEFIACASSIPRHEQAVPVVVIEEIIRGRLQVIRQAEAGTAHVDLARAYSNRPSCATLSWGLR